MKHAFLIGLLCLGLIMITLVLVPFSTPDSAHAGTKDNTINTGNTISLSPEQTEEDAIQESETPTSPGTSATETSNGQSEGSSESTSEDACTESISYSITDFLVNSYCAQYENQVCIEKSITCSVTIINFDGNTGSVFEAVFSYEDENEASFDTQAVEQFVSADSNTIFTATVTVESQGETGLANQELDCSYQTQRIC